MDAWVPEQERAVGAEMPLRVPSADLSNREGEQWSARQSSVAQRPLERRLTRSGRSGNSRDAVLQHESLGHPSFLRHKRATNLAHGHRWAYRILLFFLNTVRRGRLFGCILRFLFLTEKVTKFVHGKAEASFNRSQWLFEHL